MPPGDPARIAIGDEGLTARILPDQRLQRQVQADALIGLHQGRAGARVAEDQQKGRPKLQTDGRRAGGMVDAREDLDALGLQHGLQPRQGFRRRMSALKGDQAAVVHEILHARRLTLSPHARIEKALDHSVSFN
jgi:hypothetical protein